MARTLLDTGAAGASPQEMRLDELPYASLAVSLQEISAERAACGGAPANLADRVREAYPGQTVTRQTSIPDFEWDAAGCTNSLTRFVAFI